MICYKCLQDIEKNAKVQHGLHAECFCDWFGLPEAKDFSEFIAKTIPNQEPFSSFYHGRFKKYSASLNNTKYILKIEQDDYPELPATEYLCNQIAQILRLSVPKFYYLKFQDHLHAFVTKNFMADYGAGNLVHIYHYLKTPQDFNCESVLKIIQDKTQRFKDIKSFVELCLFDALIGNHDRHGRNLGLIQTIKKGFYLAPFYDNPSYLAIEDTNLLLAQHDPRGKIATRHTDEPTMKDYVKEFTRLGYQDIVTAFYNRVDLQKIRLLVKQAFITTARKQALQTLITRRYGELANEYTA